MSPGGDFRDDSAKFEMQLVLRRDTAAKNLQLAVDHRSSRFVASAFYGKYFQRESSIQQFLQGFPKQIGK